ncbi:DNA repair nucleotidyltransferase [Alicyclobacillus mali (ex Roth et al. 2021)]|uniref:DNA repair nucleotidyltransferase n=1 Tax=Alicyclobacillus mali (ex Roth et al. 2021) TaxID=1123961 RepID=UPI000829FA79|nr:DNA repair nucleotidyltransferase [Alicyclobacillus mali (ex Roth et al. 2021)]
MRYSLYGECEGLLGEGQGPFLVEEDGRIIDASRTAARAGVRLGMPVREALALVPGCRVESAAGESTPWRHLRQVLWSHTPWVETHPDERRFWIELSGPRVPLAELRQMARDIRLGLTEEQRVVLALAKTPWQARMLLAWSRQERVPGALYRKLGTEPLVVAPDLLSREDEAVWMRAPIAASWWIPDDAKAELLSLGVFRLKDLAEIPEDMLYARFGEQARIWQMKGTENRGLRQDRPPEAWSASWRGDAEGVPLEQAKMQVRLCMESLCSRLVRLGLAVQTLSIALWTDAREIRWEKRIAKPSPQPDALWAQMAWPEEIHRARRIWGVELCATEVAELRPVQMGLLAQGKALDALEARDSANRLERLNAWDAWMARWPKLQRGMAADFRERRLALVLAEMAR